MGVLGYKQRKGYVNKRPGVGYVLISLDKEVLKQDAQSRRSPKEEVEPKSIESLRDDNGSGTEITPQTIQGAEESVPASKAPDELATEYISPDEEYVAVDEEDDDGIFDDDDYDWENDDADDEVPDIAATDYAVEEVERQSVTASAGTVAESAQTRVMHLPMQLRQCFKLMKMTYRIAPEHFDREEFDLNVKNAISSLGTTGDPLNMGLEELYTLFIEYSSTNK